MQTDVDMSLAEGVGVIPREHRNAAYGNDRHKSKLEFGPGEGGLGSSAARSRPDDMTAFLAGVAAGADPQKLAQQLTNPTKATRGQKEAA